MLIAGPRAGPRAVGPRAVGRDHGRWGTTGGGTERDHREGGTTGGGTEGDGRGYYSFYWGGGRTGVLLILFILPGRGTGYYCATSTMTVLEQRGSGSCVVWFVLRGRRCRRGSSST